MKTKGFRWIVFLLAVFCASTGWAQGGWLTQTFNLQPGWNAIWIDVDPEPATPEELLAGLDYERISTFRPGAAPGDRGFWASHLENHPPFVNTLSRIVGKQGYFIQMNSAGTLNVTGHPLNQGFNFSSRGSNLYGSFFDPASPPTFAQAFSDPNVAGKGVQIFRLKDDMDTYEEMQPTDAMVSGEAYMVNVSQDIPDFRPFEVVAPREGLQFGDDGYSQIVSIRVPIASVTRTLRVEYFPSSTPPAGMPGDTGAGDFTWVQYRQRFCVGGSSDGEICQELTDCPGGVCRPGPWTSFSAGGILIEVPAGRSEVQIEIRAVRTGRNPTAQKGTNPGLYQGLLAITDTNTKNRTVLGIGMSILPVDGIWIGQARLAQVNSYSATQELGVAAPMTVPLILSIPSSASETPQLLDEVSVTLQRDGKELVRRFISVLFTEPVDLTEMDPLAANGTVGELVGATTLAADHPLNPFRHRYHPEHQRGYEITRQIDLLVGTVADDPTDGLASLLSDLQGNNQLVGTYTETITGLSVEPVVVSGPFALTRLADTTDLSN